MIGKKIRERRLELGMTQEQLAHKLGYKDKTAINKIELEKNDVNQTKLVKIAEALDVPPTFFIEDVVHEPHTDSVLMAYAKKLAEMPPDLQDNVMKYIDFLLNERS